MSHPRAAGFTLVEVLVALAVIAIGLAALMSAISGTANASGYLRLKAQAQWIALNRLVEVRENVQKFATSTDTGELDFANQHWHYDTRYYDTSIATMQRVVVRVWAGTADTKSNPLAEYTGFLGTAIATPGSSNVADWTTGSVATGPFAGATNPATPGLPGTPGATGSNGALPNTGGLRSFGATPPTGGGLGLDSGGGDSLGGDNADGNAAPPSGGTTGNSPGGDSSSGGGLLNDSSGGSP
jgi:general secretion pathway protein I